MLRTRRQHRYSVLINNYFLPFEARELSRVSLKVPYMRVLVKKRVEQYNKAKDAGISEELFKTITRRQYKDEGWTSTSIKGRGRPDAWKMLQAFEHDFRYRHPSYSSPWEKRNKRSRSRSEFMKKLNATYEKYPPQGMIPVLAYREDGGADIIGWKREH